MGRQTGQLLAKGLAEGGAALFHLTGGGIEGSHAVEDVGIALGGLVTHALLGDHMQQHRAAHFFGSAQHVNQSGDIVAADGAHVLKAHLLEEVDAQRVTLEGFLEPVDDAVDEHAPGGVQCKLAPDALELEVAGLGADQIEVAGNAAHIGGDGHGIVIEDHDQRLRTGSGVVQPLIAEAAGEGAVAQQGDDMVILPAQGPCPGHPQGDGNRTGGMPRGEGVADALPGLGEAGDAPVGAQALQRLAASGEQLMHIALVPYVEYQTVPAGIEFLLYGHRELHDAQIGGQMPAILGHAVHQIFPNLGA